MSNRTAFLRVIREGETNQTDAAYSLVNGGGHFVGFADHPYAGMSAPPGRAAGAYQFIPHTWQRWQAALSLPDFSPESQDRAALAQIEALGGAMAAIDAGDLGAAMADCEDTWIALRTMSRERAAAVFAKYSKDEAQPASQPEAQPQPRKTPMGAALALLPLLAQFVPQIMTMIKPGSVSTAKDAAVAQTILNTAVQAAGVVVDGNATAANVGAAVDAMHADPALAKTVQQAVVTHPDVIGILEVGSGGIKQAKDDSLVMQNAPRPFWYNPAIWVTVLLLVMPFMLLADVFYVHPTSYEGPLRVQIVTGVLAVIMVVCGFWLG